MVAVVVEWLGDAGDFLGVVRQLDGNYLVAGEAVFGPNDIIVGYQGTLDEAAPEIAGDFAADGVVVHVLAIANDAVGSHV